MFFKNAKSKAKNKKVSDTVDALKDFSFKDIKQAYKNLALKIVQERNQKAKDVLIVHVSENKLRKPYKRKN